MRGIWLIFVELVLMRCFGLQFNFDYHVTMLTVLWALGWAMIALAALLAVPVRWIGVVGIVMIAGHNLLDRVRSTNPVWLLVHAPGVVFSVPGHLVFAAYPIVPWIGVTAAGFALGQIYSWPEQKRRVWLTRVGGARWSWDSSRCVPSIVTAIPSPGMYSHSTAARYFHF